jgi:SPP1 gp7 family putative phage head morphogenesis protein
MADPIDPEVIRAMRRFRALLDQRETATMMEMAQHWARLERGITAHLEAMVAEIAERQARGQIVTADLVRLSKRYQDLQAQVRDQIAEYADWAADKVAAEQRWMGKAGLEHAATLLRASFPRGVVGAFDVLPVEALKLMAGYVADGSPLRIYFTKMYPVAMQGIMDALMTGLARGWSPSKTAKLMRDALGVAPRTAINSARTETLRVYREASLQQYRASGIVDGYIRVAAKSERTCMACLAKDGKWFPLSEPFAEHNQGRCRGIPAKQGQQYPGTQGLDWFMKQPEERQRLMLGPGRYEAWRANTFDLADIARLHIDPTWGNSWQERSLKDLVPA